MCVCRVICLGCGTVTLREELQRRFRSLNPGWRAEAPAAPDETSSWRTRRSATSEFPPAPPAVGHWSPEVTFFGDNVSKAMVQLVHDRLAESDAVLVTGSSMQVSFRTNMYTVYLIVNCCRLIVSLPHDFPGVFCIQVLASSKGKEIRLPSWTLGLHGQTTWQSSKSVVDVVRCCQSSNLTDRRPRHRHATVAFVAASSLASVWCVRAFNPQLCQCYLMVNKVAIQPTFK